MPTRLTQIQILNLCTIPVLVCSCLIFICLAGCNNNKIDSSKYEAAGDDTEDPSKGDANGEKESLSKDNSKFTGELAVKGKDSDKAIADDGTGNKATENQDEKSKSGNAFISGDSKFSLGVASSPEFEVPDTGTNDVLVFMQSMQGKMLEYQKDPEANRDGLVEVNLAILRGMEQLSNVPHLEIELVQVRLGVLTTLSRMDVSGAAEELKSYSQKLMESDNSEIADIGHVFAVRQLFVRSRDIEEDSPELEQFLIDLKELSSQRIDSRDVFKYIEDGAFSLFRIGKREAGIRALKVVIGEYAESTNEEIKISIAQMREHLSVIEAKFDLACRDYDKNSENVDQMLVAIRNLLKSDNIKGVVLGKTLNQAIGIEFHHQHDHAVEAYQAIKEAYQDHENSELAKLAAQASERGIIRNQLIGKKLVLEGNTLSGDRLDWSDFRGKVVIVYFWTTTSQISMQVLPELSEFYEKNRDLGVELIGVNVDEDVRLVLRKYAGRGPEWTFLFTSDINKVGLDSPTAVQCGITQVPYSVLIDQSGKVVSVAILGKALEQEVANLLNREVEGILGPIKPEAEKEKSETEKSETEKSNKATSEKESDVKETSKESADEKPADEKPADKAPEDKAPEDKAPEDKAPAEKKPADDQPADESAASTSAES